MAVEADERHLAIGDCEGGVDDLAVEGDGLGEDGFGDPAGAVKVGVAKVAGVFVLSGEMLGGVVEEGDVGTATRVESEIGGEAGAFVAIAGEVAGGVGGDDLLGPGAVGVAGVIMELAPIGGAGAPTFVVPGGDGGLVVRADGDAGAVAGIAGEIGDMGDALRGPGSAAIGSVMQLA